MARFVIKAEVEVGYFLVLNSMFGSIEGRTEHGPFSSREELLAMYNAERVEPYEEEGPDHYNGGTKKYNKCFRKGGPLEWFNPLSEQELQTPGHFGHGIFENMRMVHEIERFPL